MKQQVANYTVVIEKQKRLGTNETCYAAYVPALGIAVDTDRLEQVEKEVKSLIEFHLESLREESELIPVEAEQSFVTRTQVDIPIGAALAI